MTTQNTTTPQDNGVNELQSAFDEQTQAYRDAFGRLEAARGKGDKKAVASLASTLANLAVRIKETRLDLQIEGVKTQWDPPRVSRTRKQQPKPREHFETVINRALGVYRDPEADEDMVAAADSRITATLKSAKAAGHQIADPRKAKSQS